MIEKPPLVSVVMSVYNGERFLRESIDSILKQNFTDFEFIIIDDGSTDGSSDILTCYQEVDDRIKVYKQQNLGLTLSLNKGLQYASGQYIARMDHDDISLPQRFEKQVVFLENHPDVGLLGGWAQYIDESGARKGVWKSASNHFCLKWKLIFDNIFAHPSVMFRKAVADNISGYDPNCRYSQDYDLWCRMSLHTNIASIQEVIVFHRRFDSNITSLYNDKQREVHLNSSARMVGKIVGPDFSTELIKKLVNEVQFKERIANCDDALVCIKLFCRLYNTYTNSHNSSSEEAKTVCKSAACIIWNMTRPRVNDYRIWRYIAYVCHLDHSFGMSILKMPFRHLNIIWSRNPS